MKTQVVRVAISNNFNCTDKEWKQLDTFTKANPDKSFFVNSNIHTPKLHTVNDHDYKVVELKSCQDSKQSNPKLPL